MKHREDDWAREPDFGRPQDPCEPMPSVEEEAPFEGEPDNFLAMRRVEYVNRIHRMAFRSCLQDIGIPPAQMGALRTITQYPGMSQRELADKLHIQRATATVMLQKMEKSGLICRENDREDQRISRIYPSEYALSIDEENRKSVENYMSRCFEGFRPEEISSLLDLLGKLGGNIRNILPQPQYPLDKE